MAGYYGIIQSVVKLGYDALQVTFKVQHANEGNNADETTLDKRTYEPLIYRVDIAVQHDRLILFPDKELGRLLKTFHNSSEERVSDVDFDMRISICGIADRICRHVSTLLFDKGCRVSFSLPA